MKPGLVTKTIHFVGVPNMRFRSIPVLVLGLVCFWDSPVLAQDLLQEAAARRQVAIERAKVRVNEGIRASRRSSNTRAREILTGLRSDLRQDPDLPDSTIADLDKRISLEIEIIDESEGRKPGVSQPPPVLPAPRSGAAPGTGSNRADRIEIDEEGLWSEKRRKIEANQKRLEKKADQFNGQLGKVEEAAIPPRGDVTPPSPERQRILANRASVDGHPTIAEKAIMSKLGQPLGKAMDGVRVTDFFNYLKDRHGIEVIYSEKDLEANSGGGDVLSAGTPRLSANMSIRTALRMVTGKYNLSYWIVDEGVEVVSAEKARTTLITRSYYIGDLVAVYQPPTWNYQLWQNAWGNPVLVYGPNPAGTPLGQQLQMRQNINSLIQMIMNVDPAAFRGDNPATIVYNPATMSLVIKATAENHQKIMGGGR